MEVEEAPKNLNGEQEDVFVYFNKSTIHADEQSLVTWMLPTSTEPLLKAPGQLIHSSEFMVQNTGQPRISPEAFFKLEDSWDGITVPSVTDPAVVSYPRASADWWWNRYQLITRVKTWAFPILKALKPDAQDVFPFDWFSAHESYSQSVVQVQNVNLEPCGNQGLFWGTIIPGNDVLIPEHIQGLPQNLGFPSRSTWWAPRIEHCPSRKWSMGSLKLKWFSTREAYVISLMCQFYIIKYVSRNSKLSKHDDGRSQVWRILFLWLSSWSKLSCDDSWTTFYRLILVAYHKPSVRLLEWKASFAYNNKRGWAPLYLLA